MNAIVTSQPGLLSLGAMMPELFLGLSTLVLLLYGVYRAQRFTTVFAILSGLTLTCTCYLVAGTGAERVFLMNGLFVSDAYTGTAKLLLTGSALLVLLLSQDWLRQDGGRPFEFVIVMFLSTLGLMLLISAADLMAVYMGLELASLSLYIMAAFDRDNARSSEAGLKYSILGALASGMMLFGASLVYGFAGSTDFQAIGRILGGISRDGAAASRGVTVGMILLMIGFLFKLSAVPFHMWTPDVYEGAPTPVTAFFAVAPKVAVLALLLRLMLQPFAALFDQWQQIVIFVAIASLAVGAFGGLLQRNIKRLLAYSAIGHVGFMLLGLAAGNAAGIEGVLIYLATYIFMNAGSFCCLLMLRRQGVFVEDMHQLAGLSRTRPGIAFAFAMFMFSMAGIPPLAGFFGKMYIIIALTQAGLFWLAAVGILLSVVSCFYYLRVIMIMYFKDGEEGASPGFDADRSPLALRVCLGLTAGVTLLYFIVPQPLIMQARAAAQALLL